MIWHIHEKIVFRTEASLTVYDKYQNLVRRPNYVFLSYIITDLQLAAELGKALLERNRDLESQLIHAQQIDADQQLEIEVNREQKVAPYAKLFRPRGVNPFHAQLK